jgi:hypothetical protein
MEATRDRCRQDRPSPLPIGDARIRTAAPVNLPVDPLAD